VSAGPSVVVAGPAFGSGLDFLGEAVETPGNGRERGHEVGQRKRTVVAVVTGMVAGSLLITSAAAHVGTTMHHLWTDHVRLESTLVHATSSQAGSFSAADDLGDYCGNATCSSGNQTKTLGPIYAGSHTDLVVGIDGRPLVGYWQEFSDLVFVRPKI
jgi:hypothetical protein